MFPRFPVRRTGWLMSLALAACGLAVSPLAAQTTGGGAGGGGGGAGIGTGGGVGTGGGIGTQGGGGGGGGGVGSGKGVGTGGPGGQSAQVLAPGTNFGANDVTATNTQGATGANTNTVPSAFNPYRASYLNPYAAGVSTSGATTFGTNKGKAGTGAGAKVFGQPIFATTTTTGGNSALGLNGLGGVQGLGGVATTTTNPFSFDNAGLRKTPAYTTALSDDLPVPVHPPTQLIQNLRGVLERSTQLRGAMIQLRVEENNVAVLSGTVANDRERRLAENLLRLTPGVVDVVNELQLK